MRQSKRGFYLIESTLLRLPHLATYAVCRLNEVALIETLSLNLSVEAASASLINTASLIDSASLNIEAVSPSFHFTSRNLL